MKAKKFAKNYGSGIKAGIVIGIALALIMSAFTASFFLSMSQEDYQEMLNTAIEEDSSQYTTGEIETLQSLTPAILAATAAIVMIIFLGIGGLLYGVLFVAIINILPGKKIYVKSIVLGLVLFIALNFNIMFSYGIISFLVSLVETLILSLIFGWVYIKSARIKESIKDIKDTKKLF